MMMDEIVLWYVLGSLLWYDILVIRRNAQVAKCYK
jgi:hypothetical protein